MKSQKRPLTRSGFLKLSAAAAVSAGLWGCSSRTAQPAAGPDQAANEIQQDDRAPAQAANETTKDDRAAAQTANQATQSPAGATHVATEPTTEQAYLAAAHGEDVEAVVKAALAALGGIERFVKQGHDVIIKPNICVDYHTPEYAATTNPTVVACLTTLCLGAGAKRVRVMDMPFGGAPDSAYAISGIEEAVKAAGGEMEIMSPVKFSKFDIPEGKSIKNWEIYRAILEADVLIDVPIAKHHSLARLTLGAKNLLGTVKSPIRFIKTWDSGLPTWSV